MTILVSNLPNNLMCIYKLNYPNGKIYIGLSRDLKRRMYEHNNFNKAKTPCDLAIQKYGEIQEVEILEFINDEILLEEREKYWINFYHSNDRNIGYNLTEGGDGSGKANEDSPVATFTNEEVYNIRKRRYFGERKKDVYKDYSNKNFSTFERIWLGRGYPNIAQEFIIPANTISRQEYSSKANTGLKNGRAKCSVEDILDIRKKYDEGLSIADIYNLYYSNKISKNTVRRIALHETYKDI